MANVQHISIPRGDADTFTETITNLNSLSGYTAKMYIYKFGHRGRLLDTLTGSISGLDITYQIVNDNSKAYAKGVHKYETKIYDASDHVYTPSKGNFTVSRSINTDPS